MTSEIYTIKVSGEVFHFTKDQLQSEPGNYFASYFFGAGSREATNGTRELQLAKEPMLFRHIQTHLRGYKIFPIPVGFLPPYMDEMTALQNLQSDADFFGLERLKGLVGTEIQRKASMPPTAPERPLGITGVRYRFWTHSFNSVKQQKYEFVEQEFDEQEFDDVYISRAPFRAPVEQEGFDWVEVSDGAPIRDRRWTNLSKEGLETFRAKCQDPKFWCLDCLKVTEGWDFVMAFSMLHSGYIPVHYVVESQ